MPESRFSIEIIDRQHGFSTADDRLYIDIDSVETNTTMANIDQWHSIRPRKTLLYWWHASENFRWDEFQRRYMSDLQLQLIQGERLRTAAVENGILLRYAFGTPQSNPAIVLCEFIKTLECQRRYENGWIVGGYTKGVREEILERGGLYYQQHKAWVMSSAEDARSVRGLLPGDF